MCDDSTSLVTNGPPRNYVDMAVLNGFSRHTGNDFDIGMTNMR